MFEQDQQQLLTDIDLLQEKQQLIDIVPDTDWDRNSKLPVNMFRRWFGADKIIDDEIKELFEKDMIEVGQNIMKNWESDSQGQLAIILLCDQFSRRIYRGQAEAFSFDHISLKLTMQILKKPEYFKEFKLFEKLFIIMPLLHTENVNDC